jgi:hypothetical protein
MIYIPYLAIDPKPSKEFGWKKASAITVFEVTFAIFLGGIAYRLLSLFV